MCRFVAYIGTPVIIDELLIKPENSLVNQSYDAEEMSQTLNGDGFGLGWYARDIRRYPGLFRSISPAWHDQNLLYNASLIRTDCLFAHVRAATEGEVTEYNCHPFHYKEYLMMHNGGIDHFPLIKLRLLSLLSDELFLWIKGQTDSEHIFALLIQHLLEIRTVHHRNLTWQEVADAFRKTFLAIDKLKEEAGIGAEPSAYNMMITDGERIFGTRYSSHSERGTPTLYYATGSHYACRDGVSRMIPAGDADQKAVLVVSEKLTNEQDDWIPIPENHFIAVEKDLEVVVRPLD